MKSLGLTYCATFVVSLLISFVLTRYVRDEALAVGVEFGEILVHAPVDVRERCPGEGRREPAVEEPRSHCGGLTTMYSVVPFCTVGW